MFMISHHRLISREISGKELLLDVGGKWITFDNAESQGKATLLFHRSNSSYYYYYNLKE